MDLEVNEKGLRDIEDLDKNRKNWIFNRLEELKQKPTSHPKSALIKIDGQDVYRYRMKENKRGGKDYRAIYDVDMGEKEIQIKAIFHRDKGYMKDQLSDRI